MKIVQFGNVECVRNTHWNFYEKQEDFKQGKIYSYQMVEFHGPEKYYQVAATPRDWQEISQGAFRKHFRKLSSLQSKIK